MWIVGGIQKGRERRWDLEHGLHGPLRCRGSRGLDIRCAVDGEIEGSDLAGGLENSRRDRGIAGRTLPFE